jgi:hypothetical protein
MSKDDQQHKGDHLLESDRDIPVHFIDGMRIWTKQGDMHLIEVGTNLPSGRWLCQARVMVLSVHLQRMIQVLSKHTGFYPERSGPVPKGEKSGPSAVRS